MDFVSYQLFGIFLFAAPADDVDVLEALWMLKLLLDRIL